MQLSEIRDLAVADADEQGAGYVDNDTLNLFVNRSARMIYGKLVRAGAVDEFTREGTVGNGLRFNTVDRSGGLRVTGTDTLDVVKVEYRRSGSTSDDDWRPLNNLGVSTRAIEAFYPPREGYVPTFGYQLLGRKIYLKPVPKEVFEIRVWDVRKQPTLTADADEPLYGDEYCDVTARHTALQILAKSGEPLFQENLKLFELELESALELVQDRDQQAQQMTITDGLDDG
jgi:hypothetical protein